MTLDDIYLIFDGGDPEMALMKLAVSFPHFGRRDLEDALRKLASSKDRRELEWLSKNRFKAFRSRGMDAFRTIFFIMFKTSAWDAEILFQPDFLLFVRDMKDLMAKRLHRRSRLPDFYEEFAEMEDRLIAKIENMPEGVSCLG